jgi:hypothetical protein
MYLKIGFGGNMVCDIKCSSRTQGGRPVIRRERVLKAATLVYNK